MRKGWLTRPRARRMNLDESQTIRLWRQIVQEKPLLRQVYQEWYAAIAASLPAGEAGVLELGAGAGFLSDFIPNLITSDLIKCPDLHLVLDGTCLPFANASLRGIVMTNVLHHLRYPRRFFHEATRCVQLGGVIIMIEPWVTIWSRLVYAHLHHEPFQPKARTWECPSDSPLSGANSALPWIMFERDRLLFEVEFPEWDIRPIEPIMPFRYLVSGGVSFPSLSPQCSYGIWGRLEEFLRPWNKSLALFAIIVLSRREILGRLSPMATGKQ